MKSVNHERCDRMGFWVGSIGKVSNIPFLDNQDVFFV